MYRVAAREGRHAHWFYTFAGTYADMINVREILIANGWNAEIVSVFELM